MKIISTVMKQIMKWLKIQPEPTKLFPKIYYMKRKILKDRYRKGLKIIKEPNIIQNFISSQLLFNKNVVKNLGCYKF